jgi:hypothetical protein
MYKCILSSVLLLSTISLNAQHIHKLSFHDHLELRLQQVDVQSLMFSRTAMIPGYTPVIEADSGDKSSLLVEMGYIATQQAAFLGLSYLASRKHGAGPVVATGFDVFMRVLESSIWPPRKRSSVKSVTWPYQPAASSNPTIPSAAAPIIVRSSVSSPAT